jgi:hypothetical protein
MTNNAHLKRGFYQVGSEQYISKFQAILRSQETGKFPKWNYNDDIFSAINWSVEPTETLWELYSQRARQLRENNDYLVIFFSGGSDSTTLLQSFLFNNISVDEIVCWGPFKVTPKNSIVTQDPVNYFREIDIVALPYLKELAKTHKFKVTLYDWTDDMVSSFSNADWIWTDVNHRFNPAQVVRNKIHECSDDALKQVERGKRVSFVVGLDKPRVTLKDGVYYSAFLDSVLNSSIGFKQAIEGKYWFNDELFYWTPDLPTLPIKMAHVVKNFFVSNPSLQYMITDSNLGSWKYSREYTELVKTLCYPFWNKNTFQTDKPSWGIRSESDSWFLKGDGIIAKKFWEAGITEASKVIDAKWLNAGSFENGIIGSWSKWHKLG